ncbi:MAG: DUF2141 domain-containing protein [Terracidiphilus sp.]|jgi:uncharacterized protein (DUF2141 family)
MKTRFNCKRFAVYTLFCSALLALSAGWLAAQTPAAPSPAPAEATATLTVHIVGIRNAKGKIGIVLFRDGKGFPSDISNAVAMKQVDIDPQTLTAKIVFEKLPQGVYAAAVLHDENLTGKMEFDPQGVPLSGYGISNNPDTTQGPPTPDDAKFTVDKPEAAIDIKMVYWQ